jgi:hypothetical protein
MYDLSNFLSADHGVSPESLAIVGQSFVNTGSGSAIDNFLAGTGNELTPVSLVIVPGSGNEAIFPGDVGESEIDLEYSSALIDDGSIFFVYTGSSANYDVFDALAFAITQDIAPVVSISYGACEPIMSTTDLQQYNAILEEASAQGQTIVASAGDSGPTACAEYSAGDGVTTAVQQELAVAFPASSPYVTAVGGTQMAPGTFSAGTSQYWAPATSTDNSDSLLSYVPEVAWNEDSATYGIIASGGGASSIFARPAWQTGVPGIPSGTYRLVPDVALQASVLDPGYVICTDDPDIVGSLTDCTEGLKASNGQYVTTGGTSFAAPIFAALISDLTRYEQATGFGNINPILYSLAAQPSVYTSAFHDITSGTTACAVGDGDCATPGTTGYAATAGYDMATGLGSLDFTNLANAWPSVPTNGAVGTDLQVSGIPAPANPGASSTVTITVNITCISGYCTTPPPTGNVLVSVDGAASTAVALTPPAIPAPLDASGTWNFVAPSTTGSHVILVGYPGDAYHLASTSTFAVLVGNVVPSGTLSISASNLMIPNNTTGVSQIMINPSIGYSGALTWSAAISTTTGSTAETLCYLLQTGSVNGPTTASMQIGAGTACGSASGSVRTPSSIQKTSVERPSQPPLRKPPLAAILLGLVLCSFVRPRRLKLIPVLCTALFAALVLTLTGCGGRGTSSSGGGGGGGTNPTAQVYTVTLTAHDSVNTSITASTNFTLTID